MQHQSDILKVDTGVPPTPTNSPPYEVFPKNLLSSNECTPTTPTVCIFRSPMKYKLMLMIISNQDDMLELFVIPGPFMNCWCLNKCPPRDEMRWLMDSHHVLYSKEVRHVLVHVWTVVTLSFRLFLWASNQPSSTGWLYGWRVSWSHAYSTYKWAHRGKPVLDPT